MRLNSIAAQRSSWPHLSLALSYASCLLPVLDIFSVFFFLLPLLLSESRLLSYALTSLVLSGDVPSRVSIDY